MFQEHPVSLVKLSLFSIQVKIYKYYILTIGIPLKFQMAILQIHCYFLLKNVRILCNAKDSHIFSTKNNSVFAFEIDI